MKGWLMKPDPISALGFTTTEFFMQASSPRARPALRQPPSCLKKSRRSGPQKSTQEELEIAQTSAVEIFPRYFARPAQIAGTFANDEYTKRKPDFWDTYRDRIKAVTIDDVLRVAQKYLMPEKLVYLAVGNVDEMQKGNPDAPQYSFKKLSRNGEIQLIPLPNPLTLVYPK